ncbi:MAG TPA: outer membrane protein transport protein, partial [Vicinamibacteria bacterium]|nr:outer membrane protein transport protein [Vicinamibacteria bacterium]
MRQHGKARAAAAVAVAAALAGFPSSVMASGFQLVEQNGSGLGNAYAGQAAGVEDASAIYFNPAALTRVRGKQFVAALNGIGLSTTFTDSGSSRPVLGRVTLPVPQGGSGGDAGAFKAVPNAYLSWQAASRLWFGLGVNVPFGLETKWDGDWVGRFHAIASDVRTVNINPTVAFEVGDVLSLGVGANYQRLDAELSQAVAYGGISVGIASSVAGPVAGAIVLAQLGGPSGLASEGVATIEGHDWAWGWNVGATVKVGEPGRLAVAYRSRVSHELEGDATFSS